MPDEQDNVISLVPKLEKVEDKEEVKVSAEDVFKQAVEAELTDIVIVGIKDGKQVGVVTNIPSLAELILLLEVAKKELIEQ